MYTLPRRKAKKEIPEKGYHKPDFSFGVNALWPGLRRLSIGFSAGRLLRISLSRIWGDSCESWDVRSAFAEVITFSPSRGARKS